MIRHNPDLIAILVLLLGIALYSWAREMNVMRIIPRQRIAISNTICRTVAQLQRCPSTRFARF